MNRGAGQARDSRPTVREVSERFAAARDRHERALALLAKEENLAVRAHWWWKWSRGLAWVGAGFLGVLAVSGRIPIVIVLLSLGFGSYIWTTVRRRVIERVRQAQPEVFKGIEAGRSLAAEILEQARRVYKAECDICESYPPDWDERRLAARTRDGERCTVCAWPRGALRITRELHVHHIVAVAEGGNHKLENLVTLCSLCHRSAHGGSKFIRRKSRGGGRRG